MEKKSQGILYPGGYAGCSETLVRLLEHDPKALLVDVRHWPHSSFAEWDGEVLHRRYPDRYRWAGKSLGNTNHANGGPIRLANAVRGIEGLLIYLAQGRRLVLLCACQDYERCHLRVIVDLLGSVLAVARGGSVLAGTDLAVVRQILTRWGDRPLPAWEVVHPETLVFPGYEKCLSVRQPWAWLLTHPNVIAGCGLPPKERENRIWQTRYRGRLLLHTGATVDRDMFDKSGKLDVWYWSRIFGRAGELLASCMPQHRNDYERGAIVGYAHLVGVQDTEEDGGPWSVRGSYGLLLTDAQAFAHPQPYPGQRRLFEIPVASLGSIVDTLPAQIVAW